MAGTLAWRFSLAGASGDASGGRGRPAGAPVAPTGPAPPRAAGQAPHVMIIVEENHSYEDVVGNPDMPFFNHLVSTYGRAEHYTGVSHPSQPNYLALVSGSVWDDPQDRTPQDRTYPGPTLVDQLQQRGVAWKAYMEDMPGPCARDATYGPGGYDVNHNPFLYFRSVLDSPAQCARDVPFTEFAQDLRGGSAPPFAFVAPNTNHDMHDGTPAQGDAWLSAQFATIFSSDWYRQGGIVVLTMDEGDTSDRVPTVVVSQGDRGVAPLTAAVNHYGLLRAVEELYGLPLLGAAADPANGDLSPLLRP